MEAHLFDSGDASGGLPRSLLSSLGGVSGVARTPLRGGVSGSELASDIRELQHNYELAG